MKTLLIDDEPSARIELRDLLRERHPGIEIAGEAGNVEEALQLIRQQSPDLVFLDIEMPGGTGFDLVEQIPEGQRPEIVFVSGRKEYSLKAFRINALDYLTKPVVIDDLKDAVARAQQRIKEKESDQRLDTILRNMEASDYKSRKIGIPGSKGTEYVYIRDIECCQGESRYTRIHLTDGTSRLSAYSLGEYEKMLPEPYFMVTHRSYLVHHMHVVGKVNKGVLRLRNSGFAKVSRMKGPAVEAWLKKNI